MRMAHQNESGRLVVNIEPSLKRRLYGALALSGFTFKDWLTREAERFCSPVNGRAVSQPPASMAALGNTLSEPIPDASHASIRNNGNSHGAPSPRKASTKAGSSKLKVISLFCGCGGMDLGFRGDFNIFGRHYDALPYEIIWANDINPEACRTYEQNLGGEIHCGDIWSLMDKLPRQADVVIGGFPCQDISVNGKRAGVNGARSGLYKAMVEVIKKVKPKVFAAENVKALMNHPEWLHQVLGDFSKLGYDVDCKLYKAADYGVPQTRERVIFVGTRRGGKPFVPPEPERNASNWMTAREAIGDLEDVCESPHINHIWSRANQSPEQGSRRFYADRPGYTIRAECHGNIHYHYNQPRRISMREAARIQSFPDNFIFYSGLREIERQVGNAVPPILAWHVANSIAKCAA